MSIRQENIQQFHELIMEAIQCAVEGREVPQHWRDAASGKVCPSHLAELAESYRAYLAFMDDGLCRQVIANIRVLLTAFSTFADRIVAEKFPDKSN